MLQSSTVNSSNISKLQSIFQLEISIGDEFSIHKGKANSKIYVIQKEQVVNTVFLKEDKSYSISYKYKFPQLFRQYARWNASKKIAQYDKIHINMYGEIQITPAKAGLYVLYDRDGIVLYVGIANDLNDRLYKHLKNSKFKDHIYLIDTYLIKNKHDRENLEACVINTLFPIFNKDKVLYPSKIKNYIQNTPYNYSSSKLTSLEEGAKYRKITTVDNLLISLWERNNENVPVGSEYNWIKDKRNPWIKVIAEEFNITQEEVISNALNFIRRADEIGEEDILDEELEDNIFTSSKWLTKFQ